MQRFSCPHTPQQNGVAERKDLHQSLKESSLALLFHSNCPEYLWMDVFMTAVFLMNRLPSKTLSNKSPFEELYGSASDYTFLRVFGCACYPVLFTSKV